MAELINHTAFPALLYDALDQNDAGFSVLAARLSYDLAIRPEDGATTLTLCAKQAPLCMADEHYGEADRTSTRYESDIAPYKPRLDVIVNGTAHAPGDAATPTFGAAIRIYDRARSVFVCGPREWARGMAKWSLSNPTPITALPLRYEYASGGLHRIGDHDVAATTNTIGMGWYPAEFLHEFRGNRLPASRR